MPPKIKINHNTILKSRLDEKKKCVKIIALPNLSVQTRSLLWKERLAHRRTIVSLLYQTNLDVAGGGLLIRCQQRQHCIDERLTLAREVTPVSAIQQCTRRQHNTVSYVWTPAGCNTHRPVRRHTLGSTRNRRTPWWRTWKTPQSAVTASLKPVFRDALGVQMVR